MRAGAIQARDEGAIPALINRAESVWSRARHYPRAGPGGAPALNPPHAALAHAKLRLIIALKGALMAAALMNALMNGL